MPQGTICVNQDRSVVTFSAAPCRVTPCEICTPMAAILRSPTQTPVLPGSLPCYTSQCALQAANMGVDRTPTYQIPRIAHACWPRHTLASRPYEPRVAIKESSRPSTYALAPHRNLRKLMIGYTTTCAYVHDQSRSEGNSSPIGPMLITKERSERTCPGPWNVVSPPRLIFSMSAPRCRSSSSLDLKSAGLPRFPIV